MTYRARNDARRASAIRARNTFSIIKFQPWLDRRDHDWATREALLDPVNHPIPAAMVALLDDLYRDAARACGIHLYAASASD